jgi:hypothetical protein
MPITAVPLAPLRCGRTPAEIAQEPLRPERPHDAPGRTETSDPAGDAAIAPGCPFPYA